MTKINVKRFKQESAHSKRTRTHTNATKRITSPATRSIIMTVRLSIADNILPNFMTSLLSPHQACRRCWRGQIVRPLMIKRIAKRIQLSCRNNDLKVQISNIWFNHDCRQRGKSLIGPTLPFLDTGRHAEHSSQRSGWSVNIRPTNNRHWQPDKRVYYMITVTAR